MKSRPIFYFVLALDLAIVVLAVAGQQMSMMWYVIDLALFALIALAGILVFTLTVQYEIKVLIEKNKVPLIAGKYWAGAFEAFIATSILCLALGWATHVVISRID